MEEARPGVAMKVARTTGGSKVAKVTTVVTLTGAPPCARSALRGQRMKAGRREMAWGEVRGTEWRRG
jgi:hypothetical protein